MHEGDILFYGENKFIATVLQQHRPTCCLTFKCQNCTYLTVECQNLLEGLVNMATVLGNVAWDRIQRNGIFTT